MCCSRCGEQVPEKENLFSDSKSKYEQSTKHSKVENYSIKTRINLDLSVSTVMVVLLTLFMFLLLKHTALFDLGEAFVEKQNVVNTVGVFYVLLVTSSVATCLFKLMSKENIACAFAVSNFVMLILYRAVIGAMLSSYHYSSGEGVSLFPFVLCVLSSVGLILLSFGKLLAQGNLIKAYFNR